MKLRRAPYAYVFKYEYGGAPSWLGDCRYDGCCYGTAYHRHADAIADMDRHVRLYHADARVTS